MACNFSARSAASCVPGSGVHLLPLTIRAYASGEIVLGTGTARLMCAVPSLSMVVRSSAGGVWGRACQAHAAGKTNNDDARDLLVIFAIVQCCDLTSRIRMW